MATFLVVAYMYTKVVIINQCIRWLNMWIFIALVLLVVGSVFFVLHKMVKEQRQSDNDLMEAYEMAHRTGMAQFEESIQKSMALINSVKGKVHVC